MKKSSMYVVLLLIVLVLSVGVSIYALTNDSGREEKPGTDISDNSLPSPGPSSSPNIQVQTPSPSPEASPEASAAPTQTPVSTPTPTPKPTPTPTPTPEPTPTPPQNVSGSGSFASNSGTGLNLLVEWTAYSSGGSPMLRVDVSARHYSFFTSALWNAIEVKVNGATYTANSKEVSYDGTELATSPMASFDIPALRGDNSIEVVWHYRGSYSGVKLDTIECSSTAYVG